MTSSSPNQDRISALEARMAELLQLQGIGDLTTEPNRLLRSGVSENCSANSNGCQIIIKAPEKES